MQTQTKPRPADHHPRIPITLLAETTVLIGFVLFVLGMLEIGGLFNLGLGLLLILAGSVPIVLRLGDAQESLDEELRRFLGQE